MAKLNENFFKLKKNYLFIEIAKRIKAYSAEHPEEAKRLIRMGIGDVTRPLAPVVVEAMEKACREMGVKETFRGYEDSGAGYFPARGCFKLLQELRRGCFRRRDTHFRRREERLWQHYRHIRHGKHRACYRPRIPRIR